LENLEPKPLRGVESQGMLLAASSDQGPVLLVPEKEVALGSPIA
jgi:methionyl-tRNA synthetase